MRGFFNLEGGIFQGMGKIVDIVFVSVLWTLFSMPVITIGPATVALYYVIAKVVRKDRGYVFAEFWKCFKQNFLNGIIFTLLIAAIATVLLINFKIINVENSTVTLILFYVYWMFIFVVASATVYLFPLLSRFNLKRMELIKMALFVSMKHLPKTLILLVITVVGGTLTYCVPLLTAFMPGVLALICSFPLEKVFKKYLPKPEGDIPEDELDWYYTF